MMIKSSALAMADTSSSGQEDGKSVRGGTNKKKNKPLIEKRRRARINECLQQLKEIIVKEKNIDSVRGNRLEKADILELTVDYIKQLNNDGDGGTTLQNAYDLGIERCVKEMSDFLTSRHGTFDTSATQNLINHCRSLMRHQSTHDSSRKQPDVCKIIPFIKPIAKSPILPNIPSSDDKYDMALQTNQNGSTTNLGQQGCSHNDTSRHHEFSLMKEVPSPAKNTYQQDVVKVNQASDVVPGKRSISLASSPIPVKRFKDEESDGTGQKGVDYDDQKNESKKEDENSKPETDSVTKCFAQKSPNISSSFPVLSKLSPYESSITPPQVTTPETDTSESKVYTNSKPVILTCPGNIFILLEGNSLVTPKPIAVPTNGDSSLILACSLQNTCNMKTESVFPLCSAPTTLDAANFKVQTFQSVSAPNTGRLPSLMKTSCSLTDCQDQIPSQLQSKVHSPTFLKASSLPDIDTSHPAFPQSQDSYDQSEIATERFPSHTLSNAVDPTSVCNSSKMPQFNLSSHCSTSFLSKSVPSVSDTGIAWSGYSSKQEQTSEGQLQFIEGTQYLSRQQRAMDKPVNNEHKASHSTSSDVRTGAQEHSKQQYGRYHNDKSSHPFYGTSLPQPNLISCKQFITITSANNTVTESYQSLQQTENCQNGPQTTNEPTILADFHGYHVPQKVSPLCQANFQKAALQSQHSDKECPDILTSSQMIPLMPLRQDLCKDLSSNVLSQPTGNSNAPFQQTTPVLRPSQASLFGSYFLPNGLEQNLTNNFQDQGGCCAALDLSRKSGNNLQDLGASVDINNNNNNNFSGIHNKNYDDGEDKDHSFSFHSAQTTDDADCTQNVNIWSQSSSNSRDSSNNNNDKYSNSSSSSIQSCFMNDNSIVRCGMVKDGMNHSGIENDDCVWRPWKWNE